MRSHDKLLYDAKKAAWMGRFGETCDKSGRHGGRRAAFGAVFAINTIAPVRKESSLLQ
ncbi:hypothetical protein HCH_04772 [Hahella chejuensis KCTC 2396]|uniref:Uncharacterized protein n=1 Tax=Hahella chejuensis (strain KCTC 2396) TaxID=349521 RepID=Q2SD08_HAHCH|nr:hypothetical protein HCH_04772 [Hahella chejuensis KCTC 2396]